jgi:hypothetical protein
MKRRALLLIVPVVALVVVATAVAQRGFRFRGGEINPEMVDRNGIPVWQNDEQFKHDVFTFVRIRYSSDYGGYRRGGGWAVDYPDSDLNLSFRLHELTALETDPYGKIIELTDEALFDFPFIYIIEPGRMYLSDEECKSLRRYLLNGGFLMVDDFWGEEEWQNFYENIKRVFPDREPIELPLEHDIFHCVYDLKQKPQVPSIGWVRSGRTYEREDAKEVHYRGIFDDKGRMMAIICHNTDLGDGWEQEGADPTYFREFSEKWSYPMGINILIYAMTH